MPMRRLRRMGSVRRPGYPRHVHRAGMRHRQPRSAQAWCGQEKREREGAAPPEEWQHRANLARDLLVRKRDATERPSQARQEPKRRLSGGYDRAHPGVDPALVELGALLLHIVRGRTAGWHELQSGRQALRRRVGHAGQHVQVGYDAASESSTSVKVWSSPPRFTASSSWPTLAFTELGAKCQAPTF